MAVIFLLEQVLNGLLVGAYYLLIALGLSLIFSLGGIVNLAHGAFYAIGAYLAVSLAPWIGFGGAFLASPVLVALLGVIIERVFFRKFYRADPILSLLLTFGLAMIIEQSLRMIFRGRSPAVLDPTRSPGAGLRRRLHLSALSPHHLRRGARGGHRHLVPGLPHRLRPRRARRRAESRIWWEPSASRSSPI